MPAIPTALRRWSRLVSFGLLIAASAPLPNLTAQELFVKDTDLTGLTPFGGGAGTWGDLNKDGFLDLVLTGYDPAGDSNFVKVVYFNQLGGILQEQSLPLGRGYGSSGAFGSVDLADYDNDGDLDLLATGGGQTILFENSGNQFTAAANFPGLLYSKARWGDIDNDGDQDLFLMGLVVPDSLIITWIYRNDPLGTLEVDKSQPLANIATGDAAWGDYDNDGDLDLVIAGQSAQAASNVLKVYKNEPTGRLIEDTNQELTGLKAASVAWADYDNDGDLDLITTGWAGDTSGSSITRLYRNEPVGTLKAGTYPFGVSYGSVSAADFDNDGDVDILIAGADTVSRDAEAIRVTTAQILRNDGTGGFTALQTIPGGMTGAWADYDGDGDLDFFLNGYQDATDLNTALAGFYRNTTTPGNTKPIPPAALSAFAIGNRVILTWTEGSDPETPPSGLSYNLHLGTATNLDTVLSGAVDLGPGNVGQSLTRIFHDIPPGTYNWYVETMDQELTLSVPSDTNELFIPRLVESIQSLTGMWYNSAAWNDYNSDGKLDLIFSGQSFALGGRATRLYKNDPLGVLEPDLSQDVKAVVGGSMAWGDYNNDGQIDFCLSGFGDFVPVTYLYRWNVVSEKFELDGDRAVAQVWGGSQNTAWGDYDNDGDLDLALGGLDNAGQLTMKIFANSDSNLFIEDTLQNLEPLHPAVVQWIDFNRDGFLDLFTTGQDRNRDFRLFLYLNDTRGGLVSTEPLALEGLSFGAGSAAWGDYNNDGFPDLVLSGVYQTSTLELKLLVYENRGGESLSLAFSAPGVYFGHLAGGDFDNDGDLDLAVTGHATIAGDIGTDPVTRVYRNAGPDSMLVEDGSLDLEAAGASRVLWGDYDADGDLDLYVAGISPAGDEFSRVYDNLESIRNPNHPPDPPSNLVEVIDTSQVVLKWDQPDDDTTPVEALTYVVQLDSMEGNDGIISGNASYGPGSYGGADSLIIQNLEDGRYYWRVRAVDNGLARSSWSATSSFYFDIAAPEVDTVLANYGTGNQILIIVRFREANGMDNRVTPAITVFHPEEGDGEQIPAQQQSYSGNVWTGLVTLPDDFQGRMIKIRIQGARDLGGYDMLPVTVYRAPTKILSSWGGTVISADGRVTLQFPPNTIAEDVVVRIIPDEGFDFSGFDTTVNLVGSVYKILPLDLALNKPALLSVVYDTSSSPHTYLAFRTDSLFIGSISTIDSSLNWIGGSVDTTTYSRRIRTSIDSLGYYAVFENQSRTIGEFSRLGGLTCQPRIFSPRGGSFAARTNILFDLDQRETVTVRIFNPAGRLKKTVLNGQALSAGSNLVPWDGRDDRGQVVVSGLYIVTVEAGGNTAATTVGVLNK